MQGGPSRAQRRQAKKREAKAARKQQEKGRERGTAGGGGGGVLSAGCSDDEEDVGDPMDAEPAQVEPFVRPKLPRKVLAARVKLLEDTVHELRLQGADAAQLEPVERSLGDARKDVKLAGGSTDGGLRTAIMAEGRKLAKREAAISREEDKRKQLQQEVEEAIARVSRQEAAIDQLRGKLEYSRERYAYLVAQQAAEGQRAPRADAVHRAVAAISGLGDGVGEEMQGHIRTVADAVSLVFGGGRIDGREAFAGAWIDSESDGCEAEDDEDERDLDDEPEVSGEMLHEVHLASSTLRAARVERNKALLEACRSGSALPQKVDEELKSKIRTSVEALVGATAKRDAARELAKRRIEDEEAEVRRLEARRAEEEAERAAASTAAAASVASAAGAAASAGTPSNAQGARAHGPTEPSRCGTGGRVDVEDTPCPPPAKWRRAASEASEQTVEEEEVPQVGMSIDQVDVTGGGSGDVASDGGRRRGGEGSRERGWRGRGAVRAATLALEAKGRGRGDADRREEDARRVEAGSREVARHSAPRGFQDALADGALEIVRLARAGGSCRRGRTVEPTRSRSPAK